MKVEGWSEVAACIMDEGRAEGSREGEEAEDRETKREGLRR